MTAIRVVLADDHPILLEGLAAMLRLEGDVEVVGCAATAPEALAQTQRLAPDVLVLDVDLGATSGLACLRDVRRLGLAARVLVLTGYSDGATMREALEAGADGYAVKTQPPRELAMAIRQVARGQLVFPLAMRRHLLGGDPTGLGTLTPRERAVLQAVAGGASNVAAAERLGISANTVKFHLRNAYAKLGVRNRTEAATHLRARGRAP
jgi:DNA-binding NarL/FixJ family response regulator